MIIKESQRFRYPGFSMQTINAAQKMDFPIKMITLL